MQRGLIDHRSVKSVYKIVFQRDGQDPETVCRLTTQMDLDPNLSDHLSTCISLWVEFV
jgi:hypothetical protein